jgi:hypothetical protein
VTLTAPPTGRNAISGSDHHHLSDDPEATWRKGLVDAWLLREVSLEIAAELGVTPEEIVRFEAGLRGGEAGR